MTGQEKVKPGKGIKRGLYPLDRKIREGLCKKAISIPAGSKLGDTHMHTPTSVHTHTHLLTHT